MISPRAFYDKMYANKNKFVKILGVRNESDGKKHRNKTGRRGRRQN